MKYQLYYWPSIQGRGEFVRLALEEGGADYVDVARESGKGRGVPALLKFLNAKRIRHAPFAPPFLQAGRLVMDLKAAGYRLLDPPSEANGKAPRGRKPTSWEAPSEPATEPAA